MTALTPRESEMVALAAALGSNCVPCVEHHIPEARRAGLDDATIRAVVELADAVRKVPAQAALSAAESALGLVGATTASGQDRCAEIGRAMGRTCC
jgi:4-carboxymuconolactone decarboxylase